MIYTDLTKKAMRIAYDAHKEQEDKSSLPYIFHPFHLAEQMKDEISVCVALLHDVAEDTSVTLGDLAAYGMSGEIIEALKILTHDSIVPYMDYVQKIKDSGNRTAIAVKLADLRHNSDASRLDGVDEKINKRLEKYKAAIKILENCAGGKRKIYIEKETGTGWLFYVLRVDGVAFCSSNSDAPMPHSYFEPIQTYDLINKTTFFTYRNPDYEHITIVSGLKLEYPVYDGDNPNPIAKMERFYNEGLFSPSDRYCIFSEGNANPRKIFIDTTVPSDPAFLKKLPQNDVSVRIYPDKSFEYDSRSLVEKRYVVSIGEQHLQWLPHVFHAYYLSFNV